MTKQESHIIQFFISITFVVLLIMQLVVIPRTADSYATSYPEVAYLAPSYVAALVIALVGLEIALLSAWRLVAIAVTDRTWTGRQATLTNVVSVSLVAMAVIVAGVCVHAGSVANIGGPATLFGITGCAAIIAISFALRGWTKTWFRNDARMLEFH